MFTLQWARGPIDDLAHRSRRARACLLAQERQRHALSRHLSAVLTPHGTRARSVSVYLQLYAKCWNHAPAR